MGNLLNIWSESNPNLNADPLKYFPQDKKKYHTTNNRNCSTCAIHFIMTVLAHQGKKFVWSISGSCGSRRTIR